MSYRIEYIDRECGIIIFWEGNVDGSEMIRSYHERFSDIERIKKLKYMITDHSGSEGFNLSNDDILTICAIVNSVVAKHNLTLYATAVMPRNVEFGMARMTQAYIDDEEVGRYTYVARNRDEAEDWLRSNLDHDLTFKP